MFSSQPSLPYALAMAKRIESADFSLLHPNIEAYDLWVDTHEALHPSSCIWDDTTVKGPDMSKARFESILKKKKHARLQHEAFLYWIIHRSTQEWIGTASIYDLTQGEYPLGWLGVHIFEPYQGQTYGTQAAQALIEHAFEDLNLWRIEMFSSTQDDSTPALASALNMSDEGTRQSRVRYNDTWHDAHIFCITRDEFVSPSTTERSAR